MNRWLHLYHKDFAEKGVRPTRIENAFVRSHLYSELNEDGSKDAAVELELSLIENKIDPVLSKIHLAALENRLPKLTQADHDIWNQFFLTQWKRSPDLKKAVMTDSQLLIELSDIHSYLRQRFPNRTPDIDAMDEPRRNARVIRNARVRSLRDRSPKVMRVLEKRGLSILRIRAPNKSFVIGGRPVIQLAFRPGRTLVDDDTEMWLPISSNVAVGVGRGGQRESLYFLDDAKPIRLLNAAIASQSSEFASCSAKLTASLAGV